MEQKGKHITTSVPSIAIKFHANAEQIEELYASDEDQSNTASTPNEFESSPLRYLPRLGKRSTSVDITTTNSSDSSPPPWKFFSDIKGKITKSVEDKITEIKARNQEEGSPSKSSKIKDSKENSSSISDSEDISESSISKTAGVVSTTTEAAEMSSDDDTPSIETDQKKSPKTPPTSTLRQRFRLLKNKAVKKQGSIKTSALSNLCKINTERVEQAIPDDGNGEIESAVDALEDSNLHNKKSDVLKLLTENFNNIEIGPNNIVVVNAIDGQEITASATPKTYFAPNGFVDTRPQLGGKYSKYYSKTAQVITLLSVFWFFLPFSSYLSGVIFGVMGTLIFEFYLSLKTSDKLKKGSRKPFIEIPAVPEHQPIFKYEGWMNEYPSDYDAYTYHINQTQSVFLKLQGHLLRISNTSSKVPKRALWNESDFKPTFTHHRVYNLVNAKVCLLPEGLTNKRIWSKKYPICITLDKDQFNLDVENFSKLNLTDEEDDVEKNKASMWKRGKKKFGSKKKAQSVMQPQRFSKLAEEDEDNDDSDQSRPGTSSPPSPDLSDDPGSNGLDAMFIDNLKEDDDLFSIDFTPDDFSETKLYLFARSGREKEDWFRRFVAASHITVTSQNGDPNAITLERTILNTKYKLYMQMYTKYNQNDDGENGDNADHLLWINAFLGRVLFDCLHDTNFIAKIKERIARKLQAIKLPFFIEELSINEMSLGETPIYIQKISKPVVNERGMWIDIDLMYEGSMFLILQTKLNLMKLTQPHANVRDKSNEKSPIFHSDVEDSPESSSDDQATPALPPGVQIDTQILAATAGTSNSKKLMKMMDKFADSKFFQAASENRYIKKAMEGVSKTELKLKVEIESLDGTLVLNIPPPPSNRVWLGFRPIPELVISAHPIVGERNITFQHVTRWIENKLLNEFEKLLVIPNMEDFPIPVMSSELPE